MDKSEVSILIVDDEESIRDILCRKLQSRGYECVAAANGKEALWKTFMQDFDLVFMDIKMPGMSGMEVLPKVITDHPDTCIIMLTAVSDIQTAVEAMKLGAYDYLTKPFNLDDLIMRVDRALERRRLVLENREYQHRLEEKVQRQAGQLHQYHSDAAEALSREQAALVELEAARKSKREESSIAVETAGDASKITKGIARKLSYILGGRTPDSLDDDGSTDSVKSEVTSEQDQGEPQHAPRGEA
jgi:putative two-component system response regulator